MAFHLIYPGHKSPLMTLQAVHRERHGLVQAEQAKERARAEAKAVAGSGPADLPEIAPDYVDLPGYDDIEVRFVALSKETRDSLFVAVVVADEAAELAEQDPDRAARLPGVHAAGMARVQAQAALVLATVCELRIAGVAVDVAADLEAIRATGTLLADLYVAARDYQGLALAAPGRRFWAPEIPDVQASG